MRLSSPRDASATVLGQLLDALTDPKRRERTVVVVLALYCAVWTLYAVLAKASQDIHFDMGEMVAWSREITLGTPKHPPLPAWLVGAWFAVFPLAAWAYYLLAMVTAATALWVTWRISAAYLDARMRAVGFALMTLVPFFNFHALKYNANTAMMPWWALTTWFFLRSYETRSLSFAALAGIAAAAAMLAKYWSIILLGGLAIAAVCDPRRRLYLRSGAPYVTIVCGAAALAPHAIWLYVHDFAPFGYALESHPATPVEALMSGVGYLAGALGYQAGPMLITALAAWPSRAAIADVAWPSDPRRRLIVLVFLLPLLLPTLAAVLTDEKVVSLWAIASTTLLPVVLLSSPQLAISRIAAIRIIGIAVAFPVIAVAVAPVVALAVHLKGVANYGADYRQVAEAAAKVWQDTTAQPLRLVGSYNNLLYGSVFYFADHPSTYEIVSPWVTPWTDDARITRDGILLYCPEAENLCMTALEKRIAGNPSARRVMVEISRSYLGIARPATRYVIVAIPPR